MTSRSRSTVSENKSDQDLPRTSSKAASESRNSATPELAATCRSLRALRQAAEVCVGCPLYLHATQVVFGEGPREASVMIVGEVPGDREDMEGKPFVGPAGRILDEGLQQANLER